MKLTIKDLSRNEVLGRNEMAGVRGGFMLRAIYPFWGGYDYTSVTKEATVIASQANSGVQLTTVNGLANVAAFDDIRARLNVHAHQDQSNTINVRQ